MASIPSPPFLLITDRKLAQSAGARNLNEVVAEAFAGGCRWVMVREKDLSNDDLLRLLRELMETARPHHATVLASSGYNSDPSAVATICRQANGVHLPAHRDYSVNALRRALSDSGEEADHSFLIGVSTHSYTEALRAVDEGADYITFSPVFPSISKPGYGPSTGVEGLAQVASKVSIPVLALGGITPENTLGCFEARAAGVAVLGGIMSSPDPRSAVHSYVERIRSIVDRRS